MLASRKRYQTSAKLRTPHLPVGRRSQHRRRPACNTAGVGAPGRGKGSCPCRRSTGQAQLQWPHRAVQHGKAQRAQHAPQAVSYTVLVTVVSPAPSAWLRLRFFFASTCDRASSRMARVPMYASRVMVPFVILSGCRRNQLESEDSGNRT